MGIVAELDDYLLDPDIPPIRQDNSGENFCFYTARSPDPVGNTSWWTREGYGSLTVILPENYDMGTDVTEPPGQGKGWYKDNQYNVFTSAPRLSVALENGRWVVKADWVEGEFDHFNTSLYLEIHYRKVS